jgi:hypothetical protein
MGLILDHARSIDTFGALVANLKSEMLGIIWSYDQRDEMLWRVSCNGRHDNKGRFQAPRNHREPREMV